ncbi:Rad61p Ecym_6029 [Eremothecium cymbalariae DBVPG|uniref:Rad61 Wapl domain-containing protein n=1 Tax=Eremothecium cymbalariae (strain CBS 270.75 / DBVPG 7215 / KCTC 17166 / NRRL Y-17582) TaxID=931890 RepID=G8JUV5_ERECY|nr:hypothetical protein Ecym_6029 [Eremothecium cymbalariae DBVPG\
MQMKVYGRFRKYTAVLDSLKDERKEDNSFSSDDENGYKVVSDDTTTVNATQETIPEITENIITVNKRSSADTSVKDGCVWKFLEKPGVTKVKRRRVLREECVNDPTDTVFSKAVNTVQDIISSLKPAEEVIRGLEPKMTVERCQCADSSKISYGRTRTMLMKTEQASEDEGNIVEENSLEDEGDDPSGIMESQHFNQLRNMGEWVKYQDDLDIVINYEYNSVGDKRAALLSLCLDMINNEKLSQYIVRYRHHEFWKWCFEFTDPNQKVLSFLQCFIVDTIPLKNDDSFWRMISLEEFILPLVTEESLPKQIAGSRLVKLNYKDFMKVFPHRSLGNLVLKIWNRHTDSIGTSEISIPVFSALLPTTDIEDTTTILCLIEKNIPASHSPDTRYKKQYQSLFNLLMSLRNNVLDKEAILKCFIKLTNHCHLLEMKKDSLTILFQDSVTLLHKLKKSFLSTDEDPMINMLILHLGLCLNVITEVPLTIGTTQLDSLTKIFNTIYKNENIKQELSFIHDLFLLVFAYSIHEYKMVIGGCELAYLKTQLSVFASDVESYNNSIYERTAYILQRI